MHGLYIAFMVVMIVGLAIHHAAQFRPPDQERDAADTARAHEDDAA